jgi:hypothetical protein
MHLPSNTPPTSPAVEDLELMLRKNDDGTIDIIGIVSTGNRAGAVVIIGKDVTFEYSPED